jgi:hypothetical protein
MDGVFINYRGGDSEFCAHLIDRALVERLGREAVFLDSRSITPGEDYARTITARLRGSRVLLAIIGSRWLTAVDQQGRRCIDSPEDWVRRELTLAFGWKVSVIPVLTDGTTAPAKAELPLEISELGGLQALRMRRRHTEQDLETLVRAVWSRLRGGGRGQVAGRRGGTADQADQAAGVVVQHNEGIVVTGGRVRVSGSAVGRDAAVRGDGGTGP